MMVWRRESSRKELFLQVLLVSLQKGLIHIGCLENCINGKNNMFHSEMQRCTVLDPNDVISGIFEEVSHIDTIANLEAIDVSSSNNDFIKVNSFDMYEVLSQFREKCKDALEVQMETKYKTVTKKVRPQAVPPPKGSDNVMEKASQQPTLQDLKKIGHKFTKETLDSLKIGSDALLTEVEIQCFKEMLSTHGPHGY
ncbi:hypothetical protein L7F22_032891 [Adiantum nelumboides]|nr:hypothetical protein [Adiantum nelumboides]